MTRIRICFVCLGNICRSPTAEAVMRHLLGQSGLDDRIEVDSAGTGDWHVGEPPDRRSRETAQSRGFDLIGRARQFVRTDFGRFDYVVAMDRQNHRNLLQMARDAEERGKIHLLRAFEPTPGGDQDVPDPYYGGDDGFDRVFDICEVGCSGLLEHIRGRHGL